MEEYDKNDPVQKALFKFEIDALGIENTELIYPGNHVDAHIAIGKGESHIKFAARIFQSSVDDDGNEIPVLIGYRESYQTWDTGGCYLRPELAWVEPPNIGYE